MMMEQFEKFTQALDSLETLLNKKNEEIETLRREAGELKGIIEDRDLEILQLQEDSEKLAANSKAEKEEIGSCLEGLLGRMCKMTGAQKTEAESADAQ